MNLLPVLAQAADPALPSLGEFAVWGPLGVLFSVGLYVFIDWYRNVQRPRMKQKTANEDEAHKAHINFVERTGTAIDSLATLPPRVERLETKTDETHAAVRQLLSRGNSRPDSDPSGPQNGRLGPAT